MKGTTAKTAVWPGFCKTERGGMVLYACLPSLKSIGAALKDKNEYTFCVEKQ